MEGGASRAALPQDAVLSAVRALLRGEKEPVDILLSDIDTFDN